MADERYLKQYLHAIEEHMRFAIADLVRAKPAEPLAGLIAALERQRPAAAKLTERLARPMSAPAGREFSASNPALLLPQSVAGELEAARLIHTTGFQSPHKGALEVDAAAKETAPKPEAGSTTSLEAEVKRLKVEVKQLQTVNTRVEAENKRFKAAHGQDSSTLYQDAVSEWAQRGGDILYDIRLGAVACALMQIGPTTIELEEQKQEVDETRAALGRADPEDVLTTTRLEWLLEDAVKLVNAAEKRSEAARSYYEKTIRSTASRVVSCLAADRLRYAEALASAKELPGEQKEFENVMERFAGLSNQGALNLGDEADAKLPHEARLRRVQVIEKTSSQQVLLQQSSVEGENDGSPKTHQQRFDAVDLYNVSVHTVVQVSNMKYEEGFETSDKQIVQVPRAHLSIKRIAKVRQQLSQISREDWSRRKAAERADQATGSPSGRRRSSTDKTGRPLFQSLATRTNIIESAADEGPPSKSLEFLMLLYADAERAVPRLHALGTWVHKTIVGCDSAEGDDEEFHVKVASLKGLHRAIEKCLQKYNVRCGTRTLNLGLDYSHPHPYPHPPPSPPPSHLHPLTSTLTSTLTSNRATLSKVYTRL